MSDVPLLEPIDESDPELDERIATMRATGMSLPRIARHLMIPLHELHKRIDALLPTIDQAFRRRAISESLVQMDQIIGTHMQSIRDPESASIVIRASCEKRALLGINNSTDPIVLSQQSRPEENSMSLITKGLNFIESLRQLGPPSADEKPSEQPGDPGNPDNPGTSGTS